MMNSTLGKTLYGALFTVALPILLIVWAIQTRGLVDLPAIHSLSWGIGTIGLGSLLVAMGMASLWWVGGGLPMNAFPPPRYVSSGVYGLFSHPIYLGFSLVCIGAAIAAGSASGLWLVSATVILASAALVLGYELPDMQARFGSACAEHRLLPSDDQSPPSGIERLRCYLTVLLPWFLIYEAFVVLGVPPDAKIAYLPFESRLPVLPWTDILYGSVYVMVLLAPLIVRTRHDLRLFSSRALLSMLIIFPLYLAVPLMAPPRSFTAIGRLGEWLNLDRAHDSPAAAFPSFHVVWAFIAAEALARGPWQKRLWRAWAVLVSASCVTTGMHALVDVVAGLLVSLGGDQDGSSLVFPAQVRGKHRQLLERMAHWIGTRDQPRSLCGRWSLHRNLDHRHAAGPGQECNPDCDFLGRMRRGRVMGADHRRLSGFAAAVGILRRDDRDLDLRRDRRLVDADRHLAGAGGPGGGRTLDPGHRPVALPGAGLLSWAPRR